MRLRVGAVLCLFLVFLGAGCRKALSPNSDNNIAPETWITAAPQDTITDRPATGAPKPGTPGDIPVRYHMYWAGSDIDGAVTGFYWAVVETLPVPPGEGLGIPNLPGPKPQDYRYTSKTDSIFIFHASEEVADREHTFYIYAVDDKGKPDPTPARFMFRAYDRFPPIAVIDSAYAVGVLYHLLPGGGVAPQQVVSVVRDSFHLNPPYPRDTVPSGSRLEFRWHGEPTIPSTVVTGFRYKLNEPDFNAVDSTVKRATYNTGVGNDVVAPGILRFTLRAVGESGWRGESTRYFQMNYAPDSWLSGPDPTDPAQGWSSYQDGNGKRYYYKDVVGGWANFPGIPGTLLSSDSANVLPALRPERRTFFEFYNNRIWAHSEGDTVHLNSWVCLPAGGFDADSPYLVKVGFDPSMPIGPVTTPDPNPNGSPILFRAKYSMDKTDLTSLNPSESQPYPLFDRTSSFYEPHINYVTPMTYSGKVYAFVVAEDADGTVDRRIQQAGGQRAIVDAWDAHNASPEQLAVRHQIVVFYTNHAPVVDTSTAGFVPRTGATIRGINQSFNILAHDIDGIDPSRTAEPGGPQNPVAQILERTVTLIQVQGGTTVTQELVNKSVAGPSINFTPSSSFVNGPMTVRVRLSDAVTKSTGLNSGRTVTVDIPVTYSVSAPSGMPPDGESGESQSTQRPGSPQAANGRQ